MAVNKVIYGNETIIDISDSTVTAGDLRDGVVAHDKTGVSIIGNFSQEVSITDFDAYTILTDEVEDDYLVMLSERIVLLYDAKADGWRLNESDGFCAANSAYRLVKYKVTAGDEIYVHSDDRFQFQNSASVPSSGTSNKIGPVYSTGDYQLSVPSGATYLIISTHVNDGEAYAYKRKTI